MRHLELNSEGVVTNIVVWDGVSPYEPAGVTTLLPCAEHPRASFGWRLSGNEWIPPVINETSDK